MLNGSMNLPTSEWKRVEEFFPTPSRRRDGRGRPWASNRACLEGILWLLRCGARWRDMPSQYPSGVTCWRRLRRWQELGIWEKAWRQLLRQLDQRGQIDWDETFLDATFLQAKRGRSGRQDHAGQGNEAGVGGRAARHAVGRLRLLGQTFRASRGRTGAGGDQSAPLWSWSPPQQTTA